MELSIDFMVLATLVALLFGLGISNFIEAKSRQQLGEQFFALIYLLLGLALIAYKVHIG